MCRREGGLKHENQLPPRTLDGGCRLGETTFAAMGRKEEDAPVPAVRQIPENFARFELKRRFIVGRIGCGSRV